MQKGKTSKFVPKLGLVLWMFPLSSWAISGTIPEANSALTSYAHEAREIDAIAQSAKKTNRHRYNYRCLGRNSYHWSKHCCKRKPNGSHLRP